MGVKIKWRVAEPPTGQYRSFQERGWPSAEYEDGTAAGYITCSKRYEPSEVKTGNHPELSVWVCFRNLTPEEKKKHGSMWNRRIVKRFATLAEAKKGLQDFLNANPDVGREKE